MTIDALMKRSRDAARRARAALAAGTGGMSRDGLAAAGRPLREIDTNADAVQQLRDIDGKLDTAQRHLQSVRRDADRPPEVRRRQVAQQEAEIAGMKAARRALEDNVRATLVPSPAHGGDEPAVQGGSEPQRRGSPSLPPVKPAQMAMDNSAASEEPGRSATLATGLVSKREDTNTPAGANSTGNDGRAVTEGQTRKRESLGVWLAWAGFGGNPLPGWRELPRLPDGRIDRNALEDDQVYYVVDTSGRRSAWRWHEGGRAFVPYHRWVNAFSIDGMHELIGVPVRRTGKGRPIYNMEQDRKNAIVWDIDAVFGIADNPKADDSDPWYLIQSTHSYARNIVLQHSDTIERLAKEYGVHADLVKAIMYEENDEGPSGAFRDTIGVARSVMPMNIQYDKWSSLGIDEESAHDPGTNIRTAIILIRRIAERIESPTPGKIATLYNGLMKEEISDVGARMARYAIEKPWHHEILHKTRRKAK